MKDWKNLVTYQAFDTEPPKESKPKAESTLRRYVHKDFAKFGKLLKAYSERKANSETKRQSPVKTRTSTGSSARDR